MKYAAALVMTACLTPAVAAVAQHWQVYRYPDAGFAVQFPAPPVVQQDRFTTAAGATVPMTRYVARQDGILCTLSIIDFSGTHADATGTIARTEKSFGASGKVTVAIDARVNREFGRELSVTGADGSRSSVAIFFVDQHLFLLVGRSLPPDAIARSGDAIRFEESLQFIGPHGGFGGHGRFRRFRGQGRERFRDSVDPGH
jgi:hypothetical protein